MRGNFYAIWQWNKYYLCDVKLIPDLAETKHSLDLHPNINFISDPLIKRFRQTTYGHRNQSILSDRIKCNLLSLDLHFIGAINNRQIF